MCGAPRAVSSGTAGHGALRYSSEMIRRTGVAGGHHEPTDGSGGIGRRLFLVPRIIFYKNIVINQYDRVLSK